jgi:hypothetical protein
MNILQESLEKRLNKSVQIIENEWGSFILFQPNQANTSSVLMTNGLSDFKMPVHEKHMGEEYNELYFLLPNYWNIEAIENPKFNWVFSWLQRLKNFAIEKKAWYGHGHTFPCGQEMQSLSTSMLQNHFILTRPIELDEDLAEIVLEDRSIGFLGVIPIFPDEMDFKQGRGTVQLFEKLRTFNVTEKLDDFRNTVLKSRWKSYLGR